MTATGFHDADRHRVVTHYGDGEPEPVRMADDQIVSVYGSPVSFAPGRLFDADAYPSAGAGMAGTAIDFLTFLETIRTSGGSILQPDTDDANMIDQVRSDNSNQVPGWHFCYGLTVLEEPTRPRPPTPP